MGLCFLYLHLFSKLLQKDPETITNSKKTKRYLHMAYTMLKSKEEINRNLCIDCLRKMLIGVLLQQIKILSIYIGIKIEKFSKDFVSFIAISKTLVSSFNAFCCVFL